MLSNTNSIHKKFGWAQYNFLENFDHLVLSHEVKFVKPEKEIYIYTQNIFSNKPQEIFYIDDVLEYIQAAQNIGWNTYHFDNEENCVKYIMDNLL